MLATLDRLFGSRSPILISGLAVLLIGTVGAFDHATGDELSFSIFYLLPVSLAAWYARRWAGLLIGLLSAATWLAVDLAEGHSYSHPLIPVWNAGVRLGFFLLTAQLLASLKELLQWQARMARTDGLTGVINASAFRDAAAEVLGLGSRHGRPLTLAFVDLDDFKSVNDARGHAEGDRVLCAVAGALQASVRGTDLIGRVGGDEFALLLPETGEDGARTVLAKVRENLESAIGSGGWPVGISIGAAIFPVAPKDPDHAVRQADGLMYRAKKTGKNCTVVEVVEAAAAG